MTTEIRNLIDSWATETQDRVLKNLRNRKVIGQTKMIKSIHFELQIQGDQYALNFIFEREQHLPFKNKRNKKTEIDDPLFQTSKPFSRKPREISFLRKANVFELIKGKYFEELTAKIVQIDAEFATQMVVGTLMK